MDFDQIYVLILTGIVTPLIAWGVSKLSAYLDEKLEIMKNEKFQKLLKEAKNELENAVYKAIIETQETYVKALKADGAFTKEDAELALKKSLDRTKEIMSESGLTILQNATGSLDEVIINAIEVQLPTIKEQVSELFTKEVEIESPVMSEEEASALIQNENK